MFVLSIFEYKDYLHYTTFEGWLKSLVTNPNYRKNIMIFVL